MANDHSIVLSVSNVSKSFGAVKASQDVTLDVKSGEIHALIGPNGAGKSTLIKQIAGNILPSRGTITFLGKDVTKLNTVKRARMGLGRSFQISAIIPEFTVLENIVLAIHGREQTAFQFLKNAFYDDEMLQEAEYHAKRTNLQDRLDIVAANLSHGERRRLETSMALSLKPKIFLLDEPMAGLGSESVGEFIPFLKDLKSEAPILLVEHDMDAVFALADRITVLVYGKVIATGTVDEIRSNEDVKRAYLGQEEAA